MVKLSWFKWLLLIGVAIAGVYMMSTHDAPMGEGNSGSIFGRNVYNPDGEIGQLADPNYTLRFPNDHLSHALFDIEWWYLTANLQDSEGKPFGLQWTLFRFRNPGSENLTLLNDDTPAPDSAWHNDQIFMAHASVHSLQEHWFSEKFARGGVGNAGVSDKPFTLAIDDWMWQSSDNSDNLLPALLNFTANNKSQQNSKLKAELALLQTGPLVLHGENGYSIKTTSGHASHYYSAPFIDIRGTLSISKKDEINKEIAVSGKAWFDQEWTSQLLDSNTLGWDWVSLHLDDGSKLMAFRMRLKNQDNYITGSYISSDGQQTKLEPSAISLAPISTTKVRDKMLPLAWALSIPSKNINITISSIKDDQWSAASIPYYEGMVDVKGSHQGKGFIELTGY
jgi:predicted secreted hydrolase